MLPRRYRLKRSRLFTKTMASGRVLCRTPYFVLLALPKDQGHADSRTRFGFVVSRKVSNRAVYRNKARRWLREIVRCHITLPQNPVFDPYVCMILIARKDILGTSYQAVEQSFQRCLQDR